MSAIVTPVKFAHVVLRTRKYREMIEWWCAFLGASVRHGNDFLSFLSYDDEHHRVAIVGLPHLVEPDRNAVGLEHLAFTFASLDDLFAKYEQMTAMGCSPYWTINHGMTLSAYYRDPDGNQVETQVDSMSPAEADAFMQSDVFAENPIGIDVDFARMIERRRLGASDEELLDYASAGKQ
jgi:catechol-2,3-dioxygenase